MSQIIKARNYANDLILKNHNLASNINEAFDLMMNEIEDGESEDNEVEHFYSRIQELTS